MCAKPRFNFPCNCSVYNFPHRIGSGKCTGSQFAEFYFNNIRSECDGCNFTDGRTCDVADGRESIFECEAATEMDKMGHQLIPCSMEKLHE